MADNLCKLIVQYPKFEITIDILAKFWYSKGGHTGGGITGKLSGGEERVDKYKIRLAETYVHIWMYLFG